jgi:hypothetical protein
MLHLNTAATVAASVLTGALLVTAGSTLAPDAPSADPAAVAWAACVEAKHNAGASTDADLAECDARYGGWHAVDCRWNAGEGATPAAYWAGRAVRCEVRR